MVIAVAFLIGLNRYSSKGEALLAASVCATLSACIYILLMLPVMKFSTAVTKYAENGKIEIISLKNVLALEGDFFIGTGTLDSKLYYIYYYKTERGGSKLTKAEAEKTELFEENRTDAYIAKVYKKTTYPGLEKWDWLFVPSFIASGSHEFGHALHIPRGTIKREINLDLKDIK